MIFFFPRAPLSTALVENALIYFSRLWELQPQLETKASCADARGPGPADAHPGVQEERPASSRLQVSAGGGTEGREGELEGKEEGAGGPQPLGDIFHGWATSYAYKCHSLVNYTVV